MKTSSLSFEISELVKKNVGYITQIIGPVLDVASSPGEMPNIYNSLVVRGQNPAGQEINVTCEVQQLLGNNEVRAVAMSATDGLTRGMGAVDTGAPLSVPVGETTLGRQCPRRTLIWVLCKVVRHFQFTGPPRLNSDSE